MAIAFCATLRATILMPIAQAASNPIKQRARQHEGVRVHKDRVADSLARDVHARAFTIGRDLFFKQGQFQPSSEQGKRLIAHELTHVLQQQAGMKSVQRDVIQREVDTGSGGATRREPDTELPSVRELLDILEIRRDVVPRLVLERLELILGTALAHPEAAQVFDVLDPGEYSGEGSRKRRELLFGSDRFAVAGTWNAGQRALDLSWELEQPGFHSGGFEGTASVPIDHAGSVERGNTKLDNKSLTLVQDPLDLAEPLPLDDAGVEPGASAGPAFSELKHTEQHGVTSTEGEAVESSVEPVESSVEPVGPLEPLVTIEPDAAESKLTEAEPAETKPSIEPERRSARATAPATASPTAATTPSGMPQGGGIAGFDPAEIALAADGGGGGA